jgi:23S rRNA (cytidine1920-2'-O)/16S rRNA (cytidine1409-2'-O)-methyltransferase
LRAEDLPEEISLVTIDLSFISVTKVLPALIEALSFKRGTAKAEKETPVEVVVLVKPQFEAGKGEVGKGGIVRDAAKRARILEAIEILRRTG